MPRECKIKTICECSGDLAVGGGTYRIKFQDFTAILANDDTVQRHELLMRMVREFRKRKLAFGKDRLPSMSGLASTTKYCHTYSWKLLGKTLGEFSGRITCLKF
jgi:hypothetical protein